MTSKAPELLVGHSACTKSVYPPWRASVEISLAGLIAMANMLAMVFPIHNSRFTNHATTCASLTTFNILVKSKDDQFRTGDRAAQWAGGMSE